MNKLANTSFSTGPNDDVAVVDVYADKGSALTSNVKALKGNVNSFTAKATAPLGDVVDNVRRNVLNPGEAVKAATAQLAVPSETTSQDRVKLFMSQSGSDVDTLTSKLKASALSAVSDMANVPLGESTIKAIVNGREVGLGDADVLEDARSIFSFVDDLTGAESPIASLVDLQSEFAIINSVVGTAITLGVPEVIDQLIESDKNNETVQRVLISNLGTMARQSDVKGLTSAVNRLSPQVALVKEPRLIELILTHYRHPLEGRRGERAADYTALIGLIEKISTEWIKYRRDGKVVTNLSMFTGISDDAKELFVNYSEWKSEAMIASQYKPVKLTELARELYPLAVI